MCNTSLESLCIQLPKMASFGRFALVVPENLRLNTHALPRISNYINKLCKGPSIKDVRRDGGGGVWSNADTCGRGG